MADRLGPDRWAKPIGGPAPQFKPEDVAFRQRGQDSGKAPWHLLPWDAVGGIVEVLRFGAGKYGERNWETGIAYSRVYSALIRHMTAWWQRAPGDTETGLSHLAHAGCCLLFLLAYEVRGMAQHDDRPQPKLGSDAGCSCGDGSGAAKGPADAVRQLNETDTLLNSDFGRVF